MKFITFVATLLKMVFYLLLVFFVLSLISLVAEQGNPNGNLAVIEITGPIEQVDEVIQDLKKYRKNSRIKAIVMRVDSPGGAVGASQEVYDEVVKTKEKKPVVVSFGNVAASGGYYVAASATKIVSNPGTLTGSIGVIASFFMVDEALKKLKLKWEIIKSGPNKDIGSPLRPMSTKERELLQSITTDVYNQFVDAIAIGRKLDRKKVVEVADGRLFSGRKAKELGLVDELGGLEKAIEVAAKEAGLKDEPEVIYPRKDDFWNELTQAKVSLPKLFRFEYRFWGLAP